ncbi:MAG: hypothetical protein AAF802_19185 [Planctomycetota bacterium]
MVTVSQPAAWADVVTTSWRVMPAAAGMIAEQTIDVAISAGTPIVLARDALVW